MLEEYFTDHHHHHHHHTPACGECIIRHDWRSLWKSNLTLHRGSLELGKESSYEPSVLPLQRLPENADSLVGYDGIAALKVNTTWSTWGNISPCRLSPISLPSLFFYKNMYTMNLAEARTLPKWSICQLNSLDHFQLGPWLIDYDWLIILNWQHLIYWFVSCVYAVEDGSTRISIITDNLLEDGLNLQ